MSAGPGTSNPHFCQGRRTRPHDRAVRAGIAHLFAQVVALELELRAQLLELRESTRVRNRDGRLRRETPQLLETIGSDPVAAEDCKHAEHVAAEHQRVRPRNAQPHARERTRRARRGADPRRGG